MVAQAGGGESGTSPSMSPIIFMFIALAVLFYVVIVRPQRTEQKKRESMLDAVAKGDHVVTSGGIHGTVEAVDLSKGIISVNIAPKTTIRVNKTALSSVTPKGKAGQSKETGKKEEAKT